MYAATPAAHAIVSQDSPEYLRMLAEHGPRNPTASNNSRGYVTPAGHWLCGHCAGRILDRGCRLPEGTRVVHVGTVVVGMCCVCK